jgi:hypothetical protein
MASEDSDQLGSGLSAIHRLGDLDDVEQPSRRQVMTLVDQLHAQSETVEIDSLGAPKREHPKERNDLSKEVRTLPYDEAMQMLTMVVASPVDDDLACAEEALKLLQAIQASLALDDSELMRDLKAGLVASPAWPVWLPDKADREASFSVYKTNHPADLDQSFLLVFCTDRIVTAHRSSLWRVPDGYSGFPAYSQMHTTPLPAWGATNYLRTVHCCYCLTRARKAAESFLLDSHGRP